jgi:Insulinase (Peptidase family M16)
MHVSAWRHGLRSVLCCCWPMYTQKPRGLQQNCRCCFDVIMHASHRYYVRPSSKPPKRAAIALAVKVGSVVETDEESGVAHILEHLAFNATKSFENHAIIAFLESIGSEFGACQVFVEVDSVARLTR